MDYATRGHICDYQVLATYTSLSHLNLTIFHKLFFSMAADGSDLVIRTRRGTEILELVPNQKLNGDLPKLLVEDYTHWLNVSTGEIELRPVAYPWKSAPQNWRIQFSTDGQSTMEMNRQSTLLLVDIRSSTFKILSSFLQQLEHTEYMTMTCSSDYRSLNIDLPRFRLSFFLNDRGRLESHNWPGMVIDSCQSTGTMFGLKSQLVLRPERRELLQPRRVIIPQGKPRILCDGDHVNIVIDKTLQTRAKYHEYAIDTDLHRLTCKMLESKLFKVYLHAISSHCLPDPLTGRSGTQEALHELRSAGCKSFQKLEAVELEILLQIRSLTPKREFYPAHLEVMQTVHWSDLPSLAQHHGFSVIVETIVEYAENLQLIVGQSLLQSLDEECNFRALSPKCAHLLDRAARRNCILYAEESAGPPLVSADVVHSSRDLPSQNCSQVSGISSMVHNWPTRLRTCPKLMEVFKQWGCISESDHGLSLSYSREWLDRDLAGTWISLYRLCHRCLRDKDRYRLEFSLSAMAYNCSAEYRNLLPTILAFATVSRFHTLSPPSSSHYDLADGFAPQRGKLIHSVLNSAIAFEQSSDINLPAFSGEDEASLGQRRYSSFVERCDSQATELVDQFLNQWPCLEPLPSSTTQAGHEWLFNMSSLMKKIKILFQSWYGNLQLHYHVQEIQKVLDEIYLPDTMSTRPRLEFTPCTSRSQSASSVITLDWLLKRDSPSMASPPPTIPDLPAGSRRSNQSDQGSTRDNLKLLLSEFEQSTNPLLQRYGRDLDSSRRSLDSNSVSPPVSNHLPSREVLIEYRDQSMKYFQDILLSIQRRLSPLSIPESIMLTAGQWPCLTTRSLLGNLAYATNVVLPDHWRRAFVKLAHGLLVLQRSQRLIHFALTQNYEELSKELANHNGGWDIYDAVQCPDWLLIQVNISVPLMNAYALTIDRPGGK
jgi:hypothetical protein